MKPQAQQPITAGQVATSEHFRFLLSLGEAADAARYAVGVLESNYTLTSTTDAQKLFNWSTNGAVSVEPGTYAFEVFAVLTGMSATSGNAAFSLAGTATLTFGRMTVFGVDSSTPSATVGNITGQFVNGVTSEASAVTADTGTGMAFRAEGMFRATEGTVIPQVSLVTAAAATVSQGSYFVLRKLADPGRLPIGKWS